MWSRDNIAEVLVECLNNSGLYLYGDLYVAEEGMREKGNIRRESTENTFAMFFGLILFS
jgi:hypothetical protein